MHLQYLQQVTNRRATILDRQTFMALITSSWVRQATSKARAFLEAGNEDGYKEYKNKLPLVMWMGYDPGPLPNTPFGSFFGKHPFGLSAPVSRGTETPIEGRSLENGTGDSKKEKVQTFSRKAKDLMPTQLFMIDIDHMKQDPREAWGSLRPLSRPSGTLSPLGERDENGDNKPWYEKYGIMLVHVTPSGRGLRIVARATQDFETVKEHMDWLVEELNLTQYGDYDSQCKDLSRLSFLVPKEDFLVLDMKGLFSERTYRPIKTTTPTPDPSMVFTPPSVPPLAGDRNPEGGEELPLSGSHSPQGDENNLNHANGNTPPSSGKGSGVGVDYSQSSYRGHKLSSIVAKYLEVFGTPVEGERHAFYNRMVKDFRLICNNNYQQLYEILPTFDNPDSERLSQCKHFCKDSHQSRMSKEFFFFLLNNGFYPKKTDEGYENVDIKKIVESETEAVEPVAPPKLPPVFREFCSICPNEFILPTIDALMPILGTLTSFLRADYMDGREQSTTFFSCVYAPPGSGKSFVERFTSRLFRLMRGRDDISNLREQLFLTKKSSKSANDKDPEDPHVSVRIMPAINSQPEFLQKMRDNKGYHMFTFAEEVDTFNKGSRAGGGDKSDLFRVAWDNAEYGQAFKSAATFKGMVKLYYNILLTGTPNQVLRYYKNVEDGMVTRVSFCEIKNQEFGKFQKWKPLNKKQDEVIENFITRCDEMTYKEPLEMSFEEAYDMAESEFEDSSAWRFNYRPFKKVDMAWLFPHLQKWLEDERIMASMQMDYARDTFRRRTAVKGFRLALICMALWNKITPREQKTITDFVLWWMDNDLQASLDLFGQKYNAMINDLNGNTAKAKNNTSLYDNLPTEFEKSDVVAQAVKLGIRTPAKKIVSRWLKEGIVVKMATNKWKKKR